MSASWKDIAAVVGRSAPLLGTLIGGPAGAAVGALVASVLGTGATPDEVHAALEKDPQAATRLKELEGKRQVELQALTVDQAKAELTAAVQAAQAVNATMQAEAASEHWPTYSWRPAIGFAVAAAVMLSVLTVFAAYGAVIFAGKDIGLQHLPGILAAVAGIIAVVSPILGIASWFRGRMQSDPAVPTVNRG